MLMRRQFVLTLILMPITFGIWYAAGTLFAAPAVWLCDFLLSSAYPNIVEALGLQGVKVLARTQFGEDGGVIMAAAENVLGAFCEWNMQRDEISSCQQFVQLYFLNAHLQAIY